ncbi:hypothetical protein OC846_005333 [Tilletia horrida]|uniref:NADP-dependent oxidoreductase domain-containing protein n=1 Tax=Tilletia horrida TaxID=155126 RepID=A0AAN6GM08_9BASI|nr:hypothetical protein OC846_005333 [Tilletia horrida]
MTVPTFRLSNGVEIPAVQMGVWQGEKDVAEGLSDAIKLGWTGFDTARAYGTEVGLAKAIKESGKPRSDFFITTKLANGDHHRVAEAFQESIDALGFEEPIDLYLMHWPHATKDGKTYDGPPDGPDFNQTWFEMERLYDSGRVRAIGVSNFSIETLTHLLTTARVVPLLTFLRMHQVEGHVYNPDDELKTFCDSKGIHITFYSPLGSSQKNKPSPLMSDPDIKPIAEAHNASVAQVLLSWAVQRGVSVAPRSTNPERMKQNLTLVKLSEQEMDALSSIHKKDPSRHTRLLSSIWDPETGLVLNGWTLEKLGWDVGYKYK